MTPLASIDLLVLSPDLAIATEAPFFHAPLDDEAASPTRIG